tara:strand:+ start:2330 stop:3652 length:1323 start_codon:yes stop_codon:yes gene_type:complete
MLINLKNISLILTYILPIALISGPAVPDLVIVTICILFLSNSFYEKDFKWLRLSIVKKFFIFWLLLIFISFFSYNKFYSFTESIIFMRFFIFLIAIYYWILDDIEKLKKLLFIIFVTIIFLISDSLFQFINYKSEIGYGKSLFGFQSFTYGRMTGPFNDEIIGSYISKFFFISLMIILFLNFGKYKKYIFLVFFNLSFVSVFLSGERMALATLILGILLLLFFNKYRKIVIASALVSILIIFTIINFHKSFNDFKIVKNEPVHLGQVIIKQFECTSEINNICEKTIEMQPNFFTVIRNFEDSIYYKIYESGINMWVDNPLTGIGLNNFEYLCLNTDNYKIVTKNYGACSSHPHNFYLQFLIEGGIFVFLSFLVFLLAIFYKFFKNIKYDSAQISLITFVTVMWPFMSTGSLLKNHHGIIIFFIICLCLLLNKFRNEIQIN